MEVTSRHHLRSDAVRDLEGTLSERFGMVLDAEQYEIAEVDGGEVEVVLADGEPVAWYVGGEPAPTVRGANEYPASKRIVTVDAGAVSFVSDGADVMRPGIVDADEAIEPDDLVVIAEETHGKVLAIGRSRTTGEDLVGDAGKVVDSLHHVGDDLFRLAP